MRTRQTSTASAGQTTFSFTYTVNFLDVFVNGIKLTDAEFTATNGSSVVLAVGCFVGDIVELVSYNTVSGGGGGGGGSLNNIVEDTTPQLGGNLDLFNKTITGTGGINMTGVVTATSFVGNGSGLTGVVASGTGVVVKNSGSTVGTAGTINFGDNLSVSPASAGIVTITGSAGVTTSQFDVNKLDVSGISTFSGNIDVNADIDVDGHTNLDNVSIAGVSTLGGNLTISKQNAVIELSDPDASDANYQIRNDNGTFDIMDSTNSVVKIRATSSYVTIYPNLNANNGLDVMVLATFADNIDANGDLDVDGHTELDNVNIAGVVTATTFKGAVQATSGTFSSNVTVGTGVTIETNGQATYTGIVTAQKFVGDGSSLTGISGGAAGLSTDAYDNTFGGYLAGNALTSGSTDNTLLGNMAGKSLNTGDYNVAIGNRALEAATSARYNVIIGEMAAYQINTSNHVIIGSNAGVNMSGAATENVIIGMSAGSGACRDKNVFMGYRAAASATPWQPTSLKTTSDGFNNLGVSNSSTAALKKRRGFFNFSDSCWSASSSILRSIETMIATLSRQRVCLDKVVLTRSNTSPVVTFRSQPIPTAKHSGL